MSMEFLEFAQKNLMANWCKLSAVIVGLGVDPHEVIESVFLQPVFRPTTRTASTSVTVEYSELT
jgi:hypothetical protein